MQQRRTHRWDTVFLDRDGTVNVKAPDGEYIERPDDLVLLPGAAAAIAALNAADIRVVLVTNQRWLSRPDADVAAFAAIQARLDELLEREGARHRCRLPLPTRQGVCDCRKPAPGMLEQAVRDHGVDVGASLIVGDAVSDLMAGRSAGMGTVLLDAGSGRAIRSPTRRRRSRARGRLDRAAGAVLSRPRADHRRGDGGRATTRAVPRAARRSPGGGRRPVTCAGPRRRSCRRPARPPAPRRRPRR